MNRMTIILYTGIQFVSMQATHLNIAEYLLTASEQLRLKNESLIKVFQ